MASKSTTTAKSAKSKVTTKNTAKATKGLNYTAAQWKAYTKAANSAYANALNQASAARYRKGRLTSAYTQLKARQAANMKAKTASIAAYAAKQSYRQSIYGAQNQALQARVYADYYQKNTLLGRAQFAQSGTRKWSQKGVLRTVTSKQAMTHVLQNAAKRAAAKATTKKTTGTIPKAKTKPTAATKRYAAIAAAAGKAAAAKLPGPSKATTTKKTSATSKATKSTAKKGVTAANAQTAKAPTAKKTTAVKAKASAPHEQTGKWTAQPYNCCIPAALSNTLLLQAGFAMIDFDMNRMQRYAGGEHATTESVLSVASYMADWSGWHCSFSKADEPSKGDIVVYGSRYGDHAAMYLGNGQVATWGSEESIDGPVYECWRVTWKR